MNDELSDRELGRICGENLGLAGGIIADDLRMAREVESALGRVFDIYEDITRKRRGKSAPDAAATASCRRLLPDFTLVAGEILRLWQPLAPLPAAGRADDAEPSEALTRCRDAWKEILAVAELLGRRGAQEAAAALGKIAASLPALRRAAYRPTGSTLVGDAMLAHRGAWKVFAKHGLRCRGCVVAPRHTITEAAGCHPFDEKKLLRDLTQLVKR